MLAVKRLKSALIAIGMKPKNVSGLRVQIRRRGIGMMKPVRAPARPKPRLIQRANVKNPKAVPLAVRRSAPIGKLFIVICVMLKYQVTRVRFGVMDIRVKSMIIAPVMA